MASHNRSKRNYIIVGLPFLLGIILILWVVSRFNQTVAVGAEAAQNAYHTSKDLEQQRIYTEYYEKSRAAAEKKYHTSNRAVITIDKLREGAELEVLQVQATGYSIEDKKDNNAATSWIKLTGNGVFTVNLAAGEYLIDQERHSIVIRVPKPQLAHFTAESVEPLVYKDGAVKPLPGFSLLNGSTGKGTDLAQKQSFDASMDAKDSITSNQRFCQSAEDSAKKMIENFVKKLNRDIPDLVVEIEFID